MDKYFVCNLNMEEGKVTVYGEYYSYKNARELEKLLIKGGNSEVKILEDDVFYHFTDNLGFIRYNIMGDKIILAEYKKRKKVHDPTEIVNRITEAIKDNWPSLPSFEEKGQS